MWPSNMSSSSRDYDCDNGNKCGKCQNHDYEVLKKGHARDCPFKKCMCQRCRLLDARSDILQVISGKETKLKGTKKDPNCGYCQNHGIKILRKGHVRSCGFGQERHFRRDNCFDCEVHFIRNEVNRLQIKMRRAMKEDKNLTEEQRRTAREAITREEVEKVCNMARCARERRERTHGTDGQLELQQNRNHHHNSSNSDHTHQNPYHHGQQQPQQQISQALPVVGIDDNANSVWRPWSSADHSVAVQLSLGALTSMAMNQYYLNHITRTGVRSTNNNISNSITNSETNESHNTNYNDVNNNNSNINNTNKINYNSDNYHNGVVNYTLNQLFAASSGSTSSTSNRAPAMINMRQQPQNQNQQNQHHLQQQQQRQNPNSIQHQMHYRCIQRELQATSESSSPLGNNAVACDLSLDKHLRRATTN